MKMSKRGYLDPSGLMEEIKTVERNTLIQIMKEYPQILKLQKGEIRLKNMIRKCKE